MLFGEEPRKQKTRRPERRGITRAVSPKKIGKRKKGMSKLRKVGEKGVPERGSARFEYFNHRCNGSRRRWSESLRGLLISQGHDWIYMCGPSSWDIARHERNTAKQKRHGSER